ncbi:MAG: hypothetical protein H6706_04100 [Myxococcales bacterium]|nr:hypothetical protein [Myxococcales bacterium]
MLSRALLLLVPLFAGCAGLRQLDQVSGLCAEELDRCVAERCGMVVDKAECERGCEFEGRTCERRQGTEGRAHARMGDDQALIVDLTGPRLRHSSAVEAELGGPVEAIAGAHLLLPGGFLRMRLTFPPDTR